MGIQEEQHNMASNIGSLDGAGAGDNDQAYHFGWRPRASAMYPFNTSEFIRLLVMRSRLHDHLAHEDDAAANWPQVAA